MTQTLPIITPETTTSPEITYDPDCPTKRTRSGHVYHTVCDLHKPIIQQSTQQSTSADDFLQLTPSALTALQKGLKTSQHQLSVLEQQALRLGPPDLYPTNKLAWRDPSPRKPKTVKISDEIQVRMSGRDSILKVLHPERSLCRTSNIVNTMFLELDFSPHELFLGGRR